MYKSAQFRISGDCGLLMEFGSAIDPVINRKVRSMAIAIGEDMPGGVVEIVPSYRSILIFYDPCLTDLHRLRGELETLESCLEKIKIPEPVVVTIPVSYGGQMGPDMAYVAQSHNLTEEDVIRIHSQPEYLIYMVGFSPGFPLLGNLPDRLHTPRLDTPRTLVPRGSVGIANNQTGIYPVASPGGWRLIGRTPLKLFDPQRSKPILYKAGDMIQFQPITEDEYRRIAEKEGC